jgi:hypothetical protein
VKKGALIRLRQAGVELVGGAALGRGRFGLGPGFGRLGRGRGFAVFAAAG